MTDTPAVAAARLAVDEVQGTGGPATALAARQLALARALDAAGAIEEALTVARTGMAVLSSDFIARPEAHGGTMEALVTLYLALARRTGTRPDEALLRPIAEAQGRIIRDEDDAEAW